MILNRQVAVGISESLPGWMEREELEAIAQQVEGCDTVCEVGCFAGKTTMLLANLCAGTVYAVDWFNSINPGNGENWYDPSQYGMTDPSYRALFEKNLSDHIQAGKVEVCATESHLGAIHLASIGAKLDFCFIDAGHDYMNCRRDIESYLPLVKQGGIIGGHDYFPVDNPPEGKDDQVSRAVHDVLGDEVTVIGTCWFVRLPS